jgi:hypothetical protein
MGTDKAVCKRCHYAMSNCEPMYKEGEYFRPLVDKAGKSIWCKNAGLYFNRTSMEIEPFLPKKDRRRNKRNNVRP